MSVEEISDQAWFVLLVYVAAFMPWTFLASKDFIGSRWKTVKDTRVSGIYQAVFSVIPACYIVAYMVIQGISKDYKEMSAALVALVFSLLNFSRTIWGLWQLHCFRKWAIGSINALEAMGVRYDAYKSTSIETQKDSQKESEKADFASDTVTERSESKEDPESSENEEDLDSSDHGNVSKNVVTLADRLLVNETVVDNQFAHGEARCFLKYGDMEIKGVADNEISVVRYLRNIWQGLRTVACVLFHYGRGIFDKKPCPRIEMVPFKPVDVWLNWSVAFAAQGLGQWIEDFSVPRDPRDDPKYSDLTAKERWERRAQFFGSLLVSSAWLQLWPETGLRHGRLKTSPFHWHGVWNEESRMNDGFVVKDELLGKAVKSGRALPFGASHDKVHKERGRSVYHAYRRKFDQVKNDLPVQKEFDKMIEEFDIEKLEWLTILLYIGTIAIEKERHFWEGVSDRAPPTQPSDSEADNYEEEMKVSQALTNLKTQVYLSRSASSSKGQDSELQRTSELFNCAAIGIPQRSKVFLSEGNRHVSRVGEMIDAWMSLVCGDQIAFLTRLNGSSFWEDVCCCEKVRNWSEESSASFSFDDNKAVQAVHAEVEKRRFFYNFVNDANWMDSCDQFQTFMGYCMEAVRSKLGRWVLRNQSGHGSREQFCPLIKDLEDVSVELGQELSQVLLKDLKISNWGRRGVQTRFLWEVQQELAKDEDVGPGSAKLILLCILSFPSICIELERGNRDNATSETEKGYVLVNLWGSCRGKAPLNIQSDGNCGLPRMRIYAKGGPQHIHVIGTFAKQEKTLSVKLGFRVSGEARRFKWVLWRDAFLGRLKGLKEWQDEHGIQSAELHLTEGDMKVEVGLIYTSAREKVVSWPGWKPFRFEFMRFELESEGLLKEQFEGERQTADHVIQSGGPVYSQKWKDYEGRLLALQGRITLYAWLDSIPLMRAKSVAYTEASPAVLRHALFVVEKAFDVAETGVRAKVDLCRSKALLENAKNCTRNDWERAVSLLEMAATVDGNEEALDECVDVLMKQNNKLNSAGRVVCLLEGFLAEMYSNGRRDSAGKQSCQNLLLSKCMEVMEQFGDENLITHRLSRLLAHIWAFNPNHFREKTLAALQNMHSMRKGVTVTETLSLLLYDDFSSGNVDEKLQKNMKVFTERQETMREISAALSMDLVRDSLKACEWFHRNLAKRLNDSHGDSRSESRRLRASVRLSTLKAWDNGSTWEAYEEAVALYREAVETGNFADTVLAMCSWAALLIEGQGCYAHNEVEIAKMCDLAIEHGDDFTKSLPRALLLLREDIAVCGRKAEELYRRAVDDGDVGAVSR